MQTRSFSRVLTALVSASLLGAATQLAAAEHDAGKAVFERVCAACHLPTGEGMPGIFPPVKQSDYFRKSTAAQLVALLSKGRSGDIVVNGQHYNSAMPPLDLNAEDTATVLNYVSVVLNGGKPITTTEQARKLLAK